MTYSGFKTKWLGKRVDYDHVYGYQCVDLIKQYLNERFGIKAGSWGNAVDYWYHTNPTILKKFDKLSTSKARQGDIVIFKGINGNPYGHIGVCDANVGTLSINVNTLEQNGSTGSGSGTGGDAIRVRGIPRWRVVGVLRPKTAKPVLKMPPVGSTIHLDKGQVRTTFRAKTTKVAGHIRVTDNSFNYQVRGYDPVYGGRILINSKSGGGNGVALALYYTNGKKIDGWK
jgi:hypothetical protein